MKKIRLMLLRRDHRTPGELEALYPEGVEIEQFRSDPVNHIDHDVNTRTNWNVEHDVVLLPREAPIPATAMKRGVIHVTETPRGIMRLVSMQVNLIPFVPGEPLPYLSSDQDRLEALDASIEALDSTFFDSRDHIAIIKEMRDEIRRRLELTPK
jgi:hypothetical protein